MSALFLHFLKAVWHARVDSFLLVDAVITVLGLVVVGWVVGHGTTVPATNGNGAISRGKYRFSGQAIAALAAVALILVGYIAALRWEAFADYDDSLFTRFTLKGVNLPSPIWAYNGRFFPLGDQEFNLLRHFANSVAAYHAVPIAELAIVVGVILFLDDALSLVARASLAAFFMLIPSIVTVYGGIVFQERTVVFWLALMLLCLKLFEESESISWAVLAAFCAHNILYYKETAFLLLLTFAATRLVLRCRRAHGTGWDASQLRVRRSRLDYCFIGISIVFLIYYGSVMLHHPNMAYLDVNGVSTSNTIRYYLTVDFLALLFAVIVLVRFTLIALRAIEPSLFYDSLALGGLICYSAYIPLHLCRPNYLAPVDFIAVLYVGRLFILSRIGLHLWRRGAVTALAIIILVQAISISGFDVYERKNFLQGKSQLADVIVARAEANQGNVQRLYFPFADSYPLEEFASYLSYRGLSIEGFESGKNSTAANRVLLVSGRMKESGPCPDYGEFACMGAEKPSSGDLVIEMPDDLESHGDIAPYQSAGKTLFRFEPSPTLQSWMYPELNYLRVISRRWRFRPLPDRWLNASITLWN